MDLVIVESTGGVNKKCKVFTQVVLKILNCPKTF